MVLDRRMFRRPSATPPEKGPSSRGVGITSGLTQPVQKFKDGGIGETYRTTYEDLLPIAKEIYPEQSFFERAGMSPFQFFAALGTPMQPGQTVLGKIGEAGQYLDIKPEGMRAEELAQTIALEKALKDPKEQTFKTIDAGQYKSIGYYSDTGKWIETDRVLETQKPENLTIDNSDGTKTFGKLIINDEGDYDFSPSFTYGAKDTDKIKGTVQRKTDEIFDELGLGNYQVTENDLADLIANIGPDNFNQLITDGPLAGETVDSLSRYIQNTFVPKFNQQQEISLENIEEINKAINDGRLPSGANPFVIDFMRNRGYDLNLNQTEDTLAQDYRRLLDEYNKLPAMNIELVESTTSAFNALKDLRMIAKDPDAGTLIIGGAEAILNKYLNFNPALTDFMIGRDSAFITLMDNLVKGVPSDFDARSIRALVPSPGENPAVIIAKLKKLERVFGDAILNNISSSIAAGERPDLSLVDKAREIFIDNQQLVDQALAGGQYTGEKKEDIAAVKAGSMTKQEYIAKHGDPLESYYGILSIEDVSNQIPATLDEEQANKILEEYFQGETL